MKYHYHHPPFRASPSVEPPRALLAKAMIVLKGLDLAVDWELAPSIKREIHSLCEEYEKGDYR
jgi:hypothetical protein